MLSMGVRELRENLSRVLERVSGEGEEVSITSYGKEIARLVPPRRRRTPEDLAELWNRIDRIAAEVGKHPSGGVSAAEAVREDRE